MGRVGRWFGLGGGRSIFAWRGIIAVIIEVVSFCLGVVFLGAANAHYR